MEYFKDQKDLTEKAKKKLQILRTLIMYKKSEAQVQAIILMKTPKIMRKFATAQIQSKLVNTLSGVSL